MKKILTSIMMFVSTTTCTLALTLPILSVTDGDTVKTFINLDCPLCEASVRVNGIDTLETLKQFAKCQEEIDKGIQAKEYTQAIVGKHSTMEITDFKWDKYGGRLLGNVSIGGKDIGQELIKAGLAVPYFGSGPKKDWCQ